MPNLTVATITIGSDTTTILQAPSHRLTLRYSRFPLNRLHFVQRRLNWLTTPDNKSTNFRPRKSRSDHHQSRLIGRFLQKNQTVMARANRTRRAEISPVVQKDFGLWCSMPNIALHYTDNVFYDTEIERTAPMQVSRDSSTRSSTIVTEPTETQVKFKRCSLWKRAKKFVRRVFCYAA